MSMNNGNQYRCDNRACDHTEFVTRKHLGFNEGPRGWIMMTANEPRDYSWARNPKHSPAVFGPSDFCSIDCAQQMLRACMSDAREASDVAAG